MCPLNETNKVQQKKSVCFVSPEDDHAKNGLEGSDSGSQEMILDDVEDQCGAGISKGKLRRKTVK